MDARIDATDFGRRKRQAALTILAIGALMIELDTTIVNVALPTIRADFGVSPASLVWVANAYFLTFAGFLILAGRLGDLFGHRRIFLSGILLFTVASLYCARAQTEQGLIGWRAIQGIGAAAVWAVATPLVLSLFSDHRHQAKALGVLCFVSTGGGSLALLLGGLLTSLLNWHWVFFINVPIGIATYVFGCFVLPPPLRSQLPIRIDFAGALTLTASVTLAAYTLNGRSTTATSTILALSCMALIVLFLRLEYRATTPLIPFPLLTSRKLVTTVVVQVLLGMATATWFFEAALYLQTTLEYSPLQVGLAFLPANQATALFTLFLSARLIMRFGLRRCLMIGLMLIALGLILFSLSRVSANFTREILPSMLLVGVGVGMTTTPLLMLPLSDTSVHDHGVITGTATTMMLLGSAFGLSAIVSVANARTDLMLNSGVDIIGAINAGHHLAFALASAVTIIAAATAALLLREQQPR